MGKIIALSLLAASLVPATAMASTSHGELARDRQDIREDGRDLRHAKRYGDRHDVREARHDYRDSRREYHEDWRDYRRDQQFLDLIGSLLRAVKIGRVIA